VVRSRFGAAFIEPEDKATVTRDNEEIASLVTLIFQVVAWTGTMRALST
jgi:hypothetical protein